RKGRIEITKYGGGLVIPPEMPSIEFLGQFVPIANIDFESEYPNAIINSNISNDTCVDINSNDLNLNVITDNFIVYRKYKPHYSEKKKKGIMSLMYEELLTARKDSKLKIKIYKNDEQLYSYYESKSNAQKVLANSIYGVTGYIFSPFYNKQMALSITASAQETIRFSKKLQVHTNEVLKKETGYSYMAVAYEKTLMPGIFPQKKMYFEIKHKDKLVLGFKDQKEILMNDDKSIEQIISKVVKKYIDETDLKLFKLTDKYNSDFKRTSLTDFTNGKFQPIKKDNKAQIYEKMWPCSKLKEKHKIDYLYYFKSLQDICAPLLKKEKEEAEQFLEVIYNENLKYLMPKSLNIYYYIVLIGHTPGIYNTLEVCKEQVNNYPSAYFKKCLTFEKAKQLFDNYQLKIKRKEEKLNSNDKIVIYTDGCYKNNEKGSFAGIGVYYEDRSKEITKPLPENLQTNNQAELYAVICVLETYINGNEYADRLAKHDAAIKMNNSKKLLPYNSFMKTNLPIIKQNNPDLDYKTAFKLVASM
ncbi:2963_t:CDS:2, partial [Cetraspora pellucida]